MITILKETPITFNGENCMEVLVEDTGLNDCTCCDKCIYQSSVEWEDGIASCMDVNGCTPDARCYFITKPL